MGDLSGGERRSGPDAQAAHRPAQRAAPGRPSNDLDIETLTEFEDLLDGWPGTLVVVSHDRYFLERVTEHVVALLGDGKLAFLGGGVDEYLNRLRAARAAGRTVVPVSPARSRTGSGRSAGRITGRRAEPPRTSASQERTARKELQPSSASWNAYQPARPSSPPS